MAIAHENGLHVLPADVKNEADTRRQGTGGAQMRFGFYQTQLESERGLDEILAVAGGRCSANHGWGSAQGCLQFAHTSANRLERFTVIHLIVVRDESSLGVDEGKLRRGRARADAEEQ